MLLSVYEEANTVTKEELDKEIEVVLAENRAAIEKSEAFSRWFEREAPIRKARMERAFRELREAARRR
jgi:hypothetical protein